MEVPMRAMRSAAIHADINVTPLVDVCLVLLIIFMVVLPAVVNGVPVQLPESKGEDAVATRTFPITIKEDGTVYLDTLVVRREEVPKALERLRETAAARPIAVRADKRVPYGDVATVLGACRNAGWEDVSLVTVRKP
jgi:biopolymer transport protein TolR